jgi:hypothetical protein
MTPERGELAEETKRREERTNDAFIASFIGDLRKIVREACKQNIHMAILIDSETLRGTPL